MSQTRHVSNGTLRELHNSKYEMVDGEPDIRNWKVVGLQNQEVGSVSEILFDDISHRVRYLVVQINGKPLNLISRPVMIPIGMAELLKDEKVVLISGLSLEHLASLPAYEKNNVTRETEFAVRSIFIPAGVTMAQDNVIDQRDSFYDHEHFNYAGAGHHRVRQEITEKNSLKAEIRNNIERVKESVKKMEDDVERLSRSEP